MSVTDSTTTSELVDRAKKITERELAVVDEVQTREGDYLDIGLPIFSGSLLPITVKSLAFPS